MKNTGAKAAAWTIFLTWVGISAAANYAHGTDAVSGALMAMAPIGFAATTGLLETLWAKGLQLGWPSALAMIMVATAAGVASYVGLSGLAIEHGMSSLVAYLSPVAFDGVVLASSLAVRALGHVQSSDEIRDMSDAEVDKIIEKWTLSRTDMFSRQDNGQVIVMSGQDIDKWAGQDIYVPADIPFVSDLDEVDKVIDEEIQAEAERVADAAERMANGQPEADVPAPVSAPPATGRTKVPPAIVAEHIREARSQGFQGALLADLVARQLKISAKTVTRNPAYKAS